MAEPPRIVVFDWGGVLLRICRSWQEGCAAAGLDVRAGTDDPELKAQRRELSMAYQRGELDCDTFFSRVAEATGGRYAADEIERLHDAWLIEEYPGVADLLDALHAVDGVATGLLSNTNHRHWVRQRPGEAPAELPHFPTAGRVQHPHASHIIGAAKPDEAIYRAFERATGFAESDVLFFDDLAENISTAQQIGWRAVQIDHTGDTAAQMRSALAEQGIALA